MDPHPEDNLPADSLKPWPLCFTILGLGTFLAVIYILLLSGCMGSLEFTNGQNTASFGRTDKGKNVIALSHKDGKQSLGTRFVFAIQTAWKAVRK